MQARREPTDEEIAYRVGRAVADFHGVSGTKPGEQAVVYLGPRSDGRRPWWLRLGAFESNGTYELSTDTVIESGFRRRV